MKNYKAISILILSLLLLSFLYVTGSNIYLNSVENFYENSKCQTPYFVDCGSRDISVLPFEFNEKDLNYMRVTKNNLINKQIVFVYPDAKSKNIINIDYLNLKLSFSFKNKFWDIVAYESLSAEIDLAKKSPEEARDELISESENIEVPVDGINLKSGNVINQIRPESDYVEKTYRPPHNIVGEASFTNQNGQKYYILNEFFGLWTGDENTQITFDNYLDTKRERKWINNVQKNRVLFGSNDGYEGEFYVYDFTDLNKITRLFKYSFREDLFGNVFLNDQGDKVIVEQLRLDDNSKITYLNELVIFSVETGEEVSRITIPEGKRRIQLNEKNSGLIIKYLEGSNVVDYVEVDI